jgi:hypothetical protein
MLLEDAFVMRNTEALTELFEEGALLVAEHAEWEARGGDEIARWAREMWEHDHTYLADPRRVLQACSTGLVFTSLGVNVVRRGSDGAWRYAIALLSRDGRRREEEQ